MKENATSRGTGARLSPRMLPSTSLSWAERSVAIASRSRRQRFAGLQVRGSERLANPSLNPRTRTLAARPHSVQRRDLSTQELQR
jgi:hypothetical protein